MIIGVLGVVTTQNSRKRARGITWFPDNFFPANTGNVLRQSGRKAGDSQEMFTNGGKMNIGDAWSDVDPYDSQPPISKKRRGDNYRYVWKWSFYLFILFINQQDFKK